MAEGAVADSLLSVCSFFSTLPVAVLAGRTAGLLVAAGAVPGVALAVVIGAEEDLADGCAC